LTILNNYLILINFYKKTNNLITLMIDKDKIHELTGYIESIIDLSNMENENEN